MASGRVQRRCVGARRLAALLALAAFGVGVHGTGVVVLGQDHPQKVGSSAFVAATHLVHLGGAEQVAVFDISKESSHTMSSLSQSSLSSLSSSLSPAIHDSPAAIRHG